MAVDSKKKKDEIVKVKKESSKKKSATSKKKTTKEELTKTNIFTEFTQIFEIKKEANILPKKNPKYYLLIILIILIGLIYLMWPKITILGDNPVTINYNEVYNEPGYKGTWISKKKELF